MSSTFGCPCQVASDGNRICNYDLSRHILAQTPDEPGRTEARVKCPFCGQVAIFALEWRLELTPHVMASMSEEG